MNVIAAGLGNAGVRVLRFEFPYMAARRSGKRKPPDREPVLLDTWRSVIADMTGPVAIGGKSMGGRVASLVADDLYGRGRCKGLVCLGYPFHPPKKPEQLRTAHLESLRCPALIVQGERDPFGAREEVEALKLSATIAFHWAPDGDHDLGPRGASGFTRKGNLAAAADAVASFARTTAGL